MNKFGLKNSHFVLLPMWDFEHYKYFYKFSFKSWTGPEQKQMIAENVRNQLDNLVESFKNILETG
ncbi:MAG: hypothetical protein WHS64_09545 [Fervidobacterium sp.]|uniref:hypothetical protein n=1 Tax=Fervidobacterium TaxID=2422 RepID=UPI00309DBC8C